MRYGRQHSHSRCRAPNWLILSAFLFGMCGCQTGHYYKQAIHGQWQILRQREPVATLLADPQTEPKLKQQFELILQFRVLAQTELGLPINKHYLTYVDLGRDFAVWNVHAAPEFSLEPKKWWYPLVGSLKYRGYFEEKEARRYAEHLAREGFDVYVEGVEAYSTLGWFADPLLNTFIRSPELDLAEIIFHELAHQRLFLNGDTDFNEAFATTVAEEGVRRWLRTRSDATALLQRYRTGLQRNEQFVSIVLRARRALEELYSDRSRRLSPPLRQREKKERIIAALRQEYQALKQSWGGYDGYDRWMAQSLNNAQLNTIAVYYELVPGFRALLFRTGGDLEAFYRKVSSLQRLSKTERAAYLRRLGQAYSRLEEYPTPTG